MTGMINKNRQVLFHDLGMVDYKECWDLQETLLTELVNHKTGKSPGSDPHHYLLFCTHPHVYTLGKSGSDSHLLLNEDMLAAKQATYYRINRGGDITYHGPGQLVGYPVFDLDYFFNDIHKYLRLLEESIILTCADYGITAGRIPGLTGVWIDTENPSSARKICAFGVRCSRWVTMHGFAFNINTDLSYFGGIVPCGIADKGVTSLQKETGKEIDEEEVKIKVLLYMQQLFDFNITSGNNETLPWPDRINNTL